MAGGTTHAPGLLASTAETRRIIFAGIFLRVHAESFQERRRVRTDAPLLSAVLYLGLVVPGGGPLLWSISELIEG
jgi:hypothetical protein